VGNGGTQRLGGFPDPTLAACGFPAGGVVGGEGKPGVGEEVLQGTGEGASAAASPAGLLEDRLWTRRGGLGEQAAEAADHQRGPSRAVPGGGVRGELAQPGRRVGQPGGEALGLPG
jgi:hypothetical protein